MGSVLGGGGAKKAAKAQAAAIDKQTNLQTATTNAQVQALSDQMANAAAQQVATEYAQRLLDKPAETVAVQLGTSDLALKTADLMGTRPNARAKYQQFSVQAPPPNSITLI